MVEVPPPETGDAAVLHAQGLLKLDGDAAESDDSVVLWLREFEFAVLLYNLLPGRIYCFSVVEFQAE